MFPLPSHKSQIIGVVPPLISTCFFSFAHLIKRFYVYVTARRKARDETCYERTTKEKEMHEFLLISETGF